MSKRIGSPILAGALALGLLGCGHAPTAPLVDSPEGLTKSEASVGNMARARPTPAAGADQPDPPTPKQAKTTINVNGESGQSMALMHVHLIIPKHTFHGKADITITEPDSTQLEAHLSITPADKNQFDKPVTLVFDAADCGADCRVMQILWFDPAQNVWVPIESTSDAANGTISAQLMHFSNYKAVCETKRVGW